MRSFDERMEEIRRRADALRKERRRKNAAACCCLAGAACLCLVLWNPIMAPKKQALPEGVGAAGAGGNVHYSASGSSVKEIRVSGMGKESVIQDTEKILHFLAIAQQEMLSENPKENGTPSETTPLENCDIVGVTRGENHTPPSGGRSEDDVGEIQSESVPENCEDGRENKTSDILKDNWELTCTVRLILADGEEKQYLLTEEALVNAETGSAVSLDQNQRQLLMELLGIG